MGISTCLLWYQEMQLYVHVAQKFATQGKLTQTFPTIPNPIVNLDFHMKTQGCDEYHIIGEIV